MTAFLAKRLAGGLVTLLVASVVVFAVLEILPGDPAQLMLGMNATDATLNALREQMGLNDPVLVRYLSWVGGLLVGDFGRSFTYSSPVIELIGERAVVSLPLAIMALLLSTAIAIPVGLFAAARRGKAADTISMGTAQIGVAIPNFWFALILIYVFAVWLRLVPAGGFPGWGGGIWPGIKSLIMPAVALALPQAAILARITRSALLEVLGEDYIRHRPRQGHAAARCPVAARAAQRHDSGADHPGAAVRLPARRHNHHRERLLSPGLGRLVFQAITQRDLIVVEGVVMLLVASVVLVNIVVESSMPSSIRG